MTQRATATEIGRPSLSLPFAHLNLRRNPFGELDRGERAELAVADVDHFVDRLRRPGFAVQFLGDCGRGKTTHILALNKHFPNVTYTHIAEGERPPIPAGHPLFIDEAQRLPRWRRRRIFRRAVSFVIGSHEDHARELRSAGVEVETIHVPARLDVEQLAKIFNRRIEASRRSPGPLPVISRRKLQQLLDECGTDIRAMEGHLYELFQGLEHVAAI